MQGDAKAGVCTGCVLETLGSGPISTIFEKRIVPFDLSFYNDTRTADERGKEAKVSNSIVAM